MDNKHHSVNPGLRVLLADVGIDPENLLRQADLPVDLFNRTRALLTTEEYFRMVEATEAISDDELIPLKMGSAITVESFDPPLFAAMCSPDLNLALQRISHYKRLCGPMILNVDITKRDTSISFEWIDKTVKPPRALIALELVFFVQLARIATRHDIKPLKVGSPVKLLQEEAYQDYFGIKVGKSKLPTVTFDAWDAQRPFLTANDKMWEYFEPELRVRLSELDQNSTMAARVRTALIELLPVGEVTLEAVSHKLGVSKRTLQRNLNSEGANFQQILNSARETVAKHYLKTSDMSGAEISFLLGFKEPSSFFRAYQSWTGSTPENSRKSLRQSAFGN